MSRMSRGKSLQIFVVLTFSLFFLNVWLNGQTGMPERSDGTPIVIEDKGFSMAPPKGWEIRKDSPGVSLFLRIPKDKKLLFQRNIQVLAFNGPMFIDEETQKDFGQKIVSEFRKNASFAANFSLRDSMIVTLQNSSKGILFYTDFDGVIGPMMQAHLLVSSHEHHFLVTFTDIRKNFEQGQNDPILKEAWESLTSVKLQSEAPGRVDWILWAIVLVALVLLGGAGLLLYAKRVEKARIVADDDQATHDQLDFSGVDEESVEEDVIDISDDLDLGEKKDADVSDDEEENGSGKWNLSKKEKVAASQNEDEDDI